MFQLCQQQQQQDITIGINSVNVHDLYHEKKTYKLKRSIRDVTKTTAIGIPNKQWVLLTEQMICFVFVRFALFCFIFSRKFLCRRCTTTTLNNQIFSIFCMYNRKDKAKKFYCLLMTSDAVPYLQLPADFP